MTEQELLSQYVETKSADAFQRLAATRVDTDASVCRRQIWFLWCGDQL
jgi:hypothetical protein